MSSTTSEDIHETGQSVESLCRAGLIKKNGTSWLCVLCHVSIASKSSMTRHLKSTKHSSSYTMHKHFLEEEDESRVFDCADIGLEECVAACEKYV
jgi:hypothetical protein